jgi:hypothetical protein
LAAFDGCSMRHSACNVHPYFGVGLLDADCHERSTVARWGTRA